MARNGPGRSKVDDALDVLRQLGFPRQQQNERSALTLLILLGLKPGDPWSGATDPMLGITQMMDRFRDHYSKQYAPNSRETVRRQTVHQFLQAALIVKNPDRPDRPTNSGKTVYRIDEAALGLLRHYGTSRWAELRDKYLAERPALQQVYDSYRKMAGIPLRLSSGKEVRLSPGGQNTLVKEICVEFARRFTPGGTLLYVGDTAEKFAHFNRKALGRLGVSLEPHGKIPDVIIYDMQRNWLFLVEAVTTHGPIDAKRRRELQELFAGSKAGLVYVTAFTSKEVMKRYVAEISWETEVWVAESPDHMIHFDGERFLGPYMHSSDK